MTHPRTKPNRPSLPTVLPELVAYYEVHGGHWGRIFHCMLDDGNVGESFAEAQVEEAVREGDAEAERIARILLSMSPTQRRRVDGEVQKVVRKKYEERQAAWREANGVKLNVGEGGTPG